MSGYDNNNNSIINNSIVNNKNHASTSKYTCVKCNFKCIKNSDWDRHLATKKHNKEVASSMQHSSHVCSCGKSYSSRYRFNIHERSCISSNTVEQVPHATSQSTSQSTSTSSTAIVSQQPVQQFTMTTDFIMELIHQNHELKNLLLEEREARREDKEELIHIIDEKIDILSAKQSTIINNTNTNTTQFNLNIFLNEKCKDAITLTQFVNSLDVGPQHVEYTGVHGYVAGISKIFMDGLRQLDVCKRPIHCTDLKREILYIKEDNVWEKDNPEKSKFKKALNIVVRKNMQQVSTWVHENPSCEILDTNEYHLHLNIMRQCIGGDIAQEDTNNRKIMRNIAKEVLIDKHSIF
jgi:hypothetical protein